MKNEMPTGIYIVVTFSTESGSFIALADKYSSYHELMQLSQDGARCSAIKSRTMLFP